MSIPVYTHTYTLIHTLHYACCYDEIKGTQDFKICSSHADSLHDSLSRRMHVCVGAAPVIDACGTAGGRHPGKSNAGNETTR